jgi:hypothetical protein
VVAVSSTRIRFEQPGGADLAVARQRTTAEGRSANTTAVIVLVLSCVCTALALFDLLLLASGL